MPKRSPNKAEEKKAPAQEVLIIDDDQFMAGLFVYHLKKAGLKVILAPDGRIGLKIARDEKPDAILLDVIMPEMNGFEVLHKLKHDEETKDIPVIMLTSLHQKEDVERSISEGAAGYLTKTSTVPEQTADAVRKAIREAKEGAKD